MEQYLSQNPGWRNEAWSVRAAFYEEIGDKKPFQALSEYNEGVGASRQGQYGEAIRHYEKAYELDPGFLWSANNLAWELSTCPDAKLRNGRRAITFAEKAIAGTSTFVPDFWGTLAAAYAADGQYEKAVALCQRVLEVYPTAKTKEMMENFKAGKPFTDQDQPPEKRKTISSEGFGPAKWGMTKLAVKRAYKNLRMETNDLLVSGEDFFADEPAEIGFLFFGDTLWKVEVAIPNIDTEDKEKAVLGYLIKNHGNPARIQALQADRFTFAWNGDITAIEATVLRKEQMVQVEYACAETAKTLKEAEEIRRSAASNSDKASAGKSTEKDEGFYREPGTGVTFPPYIAGLKRVETRKYPQQELGTSLKYVSERGVAADVYLYNFGLSSIPDGISDAVTQQFLGSKKSIQDGQTKGVYQSVVHKEDGMRPLVLGERSLPCLCAVFEIKKEGREVPSYLLVSGYRNHFLKLRVSFDGEDKSGNEGLLASFLLELGKVLSQ